MSLYNREVSGAFTYNLSVRLRPESGFEILTKCGACQHFLQIFQPALTRTRVYIQEDQDFFMFLLLTINLSIYLYFFEELERFRDSCLLPQGNNQSIAVDLKELTFWLYQTYGQRDGLGWGDQWYSFPILGTTTHQYPPTRRKPKLLPKTTKSCHKRSLPLGRGTLFGENERYCKHSDFLSWVLGYCTSA